jgi:hypothetical protein
VHVEVCLDLAALLFEQHGEEKSGAKPPSKRRKKLGATARPELRGPVPVLLEKIRPYHDVPVLYIR